VKTIKIVVGGQVEKQEIAALVRDLVKDRAEVEIMSDLQAANAIKTGKADYYLGACHTGGGGALSMAMALLGRDKCETVSMPGRPPVKEKIVEAVARGKVAFGFTGDHAQTAVPLIIEEILKK
jgi:hypothetical protein